VELDITEGELSNHIDPAAHDQECRGACGGGRAQRGAAFQAQAAQM
jgi:hypothetical protein